MNKIWRYLLNKFKRPGFLIGKSNFNAWFFLEERWVFIPKGTLIRFGSKVTSTYPTKEDLDLSIKS